MAEPTGIEQNQSVGTQEVDRFAKGFQPTQDEITVVTNFLQRVTRAEEEPKRKAWADQLETLRAYFEGTEHEEKAKMKNVRTNMVFATIAAMMPELYAKNPVISVTPTDAVPNEQVGMVKKFSATAEKVIRKLLVEEGRLKKRAKANIRAAAGTGYGVLKMVYQSNYHGDPVTIRRIEDTQDNLARVEMLTTQVKEETDVGKLAQQRDELRANLKSLASSEEVGIFKGFAVDRMKSEDFLVLDDSVDEFDEYLDARALAHKIWMTVAQAMTQFKLQEVIGATRFNAPRTTDTKASDNTPPEEQYICVLEIWDKEDGVVRTTAKGMNRWLREPYVPEHTPQRWYPFYVLGFNLVEGRWRPISDVELLMGLQDEYTHTRMNYADVREKAVPVLIFRKAGGLTEEDIKNITNRRGKDTIGVEGIPTTPLSQDLVWFDGGKIDPAAYDVTMIRNDMDLVSGRSDASRANLIKPKTATEAEIMNDAMQSRVGERRDTHEDLLSDMGEAALEVALKCLTKEEVQQIAGMDATWPDQPQSAEEVFTMVTVKVRAGSSGKPNQQKEREQWTQLMPVIKETMQQVMELRMQGNYDMAEALIELLRETIRRFDESLDLDAIIPPIEKDEQGKPKAATQAAMELVQVKEQLQQLQEELAKCQQDLQKAQLGDQSKAAEAQAKAQADAATAAAARQAADIKAAQDQQLAANKAQAEREAAARADEEEARQAERDLELKLEQQQTEQEKIRAEDARSQRELDAKLALDKHLAILKAAVDVLGRRADAEGKKAEAEGKKAEADGKAKKEEAAEAESSAKTEQKLEGIVGELKDLIGSLGGAFEKLSKDSAERTQLVKQHLSSE